MYPNNPPVKIRKDPNSVALEFDEISMDEIKDMAQQLDTDPAGVLLQAYQMFRLAQGRTVVFRQKQSETTLMVKDFANKKKMVKG